ncbi:MAG TPA: hypothetical protein VMA09_18695 [Candidatus Binataceae bacterium]|nr:hypothetical protein [Candidatus Binataceae bacterium]
MAWQRGMRAWSASGYVVRDADIPDRLELDSSPRSQSVETFVMTRAAERAWLRFNQHLESARGAVFWVSGPAGCGKTHFLNYLLALQNRAGAMTAESSRRLTCGIELAGRVGASELEAYLLSAIAEQIGARGDELWRTMRGAAALQVALQQAARVGFHALTIAIDCGLAECRAVDDYVETIAEVAANAKRARLNLIIAARSRGPRAAQALEVAPADSIEGIGAAIRRTRELGEGADALVARAYAGMEMRGFDPLGIYPFHPHAAAALPGIAGPPLTFARVARIALGAEQANRERVERLIYPADLLAFAATARLGDSGTDALAIIRDAAQAYVGNEAELAREIVDTLVVEHLAGVTASLTLTEIQARLPSLAQRVGESWTRNAIEGVLDQLAARTRGVIRFDADGARFDPSAAAVPEVARFNSALKLVRRFDPALSASRELPELSAKLKRLENAMGSRADAAIGVERLLAGAVRESGMTTSAEQSRTIAEFVALAQGSARGLIELGADSARAEAALKTVAAYEAIAAAAAAIPRLATMREYLKATGLRASSELPSGRDGAIVALETECELLAIETSPRALSAIPRALKALEARFQKFKWTYVQLYCVAHENWRAELARLDPIAEDARRHLEALTRLNAISALGPPVSAELDAAVKLVATRVRRCDFDGPLAPETMPRCPGCSFTLGTEPPRQALSDLLDRLRRAINSKLAALSQSVIAALIREHDTGRRLEGVLKIIQASQTDALVQVLDERLARYLAQLLDDNLGAAQPPRQPISIVEPASSHAPMRRHARDPNSRFK